MKRRIILCAVIGLICGIVWPPYKISQGQVIGPCYTLYNQNNITASAATPTAVPISTFGDSFLAYSVLTEDSGTATVDIALEHSNACDGTFVALKDKSGTAVTFAQASATDAMATVKFQATAFPCVRSPITVTGTGQWDVKVVLCVEGRR